MPILYNIDKKKGFFRVPVGGTQSGGDCSFSYSAASYKTSDSDPTPTITGDAGGVFSSTAGLVINSATGEITLATSTIASYVVTYTVSGNICTQNLEVTAGAIDNVYSFLFDGVDDYIDCGNPAELQITGALTVSAWVKFTGGSTDVIVSKDENGSWRCWALWGEYGGVPLFVIYSSNVAYIVNGTAAIDDGDWHHVVGVFEPSIAVRIYIDGNLDASNTTTIPATIDNDPVNVVIGEGVGGYYFPGNIDEVAIWDSVLSASDVSDIYNDTSTGKTADLSLMATPPVAWYRMGD